VIAKTLTAGLLVLTGLFVQASGAAALSQLPGPAGCVNLGGTKGCQSGRAMSEPFSGLAVSPDGKSAYLAAGDAGAIESNAIDIFYRDPATGALTQKAGGEGCISTTGKAGCQTNGLVEGAGDVVLSPDGKNVYAATKAGVSIFDRDPGTGALTQKPGVEGCLTSLPELSSFCELGVGLGESTSVALSPDGRGVYVTRRSHPIVAILERDPATGTLSQQPGVGGCVSATPGPSSCQGDRAREGATGVATVSPDGRNVYVTAFAAGRGNVTSFARDSNTGALTRIRGRSGCLSQEGRGGCRRGRGLQAIRGLTISPDGTSLYISSTTSNTLAGGISIFARRPSGALVQKPGRAWCVSENGSHGECQNRNALGDAGEIAISPDGRSLYVDSHDGLTIFARSNSGALTQDPGRKSCFSASSKRCEKARNVDGASGVAVSPDGANVYVSGFYLGGVATFRR
jgi:DNA-binding beta-propeller fold protein YncE